MRLGARDGTNAPITQRLDLPTAPSKSDSLSSSCILSNATAKQIQVGVQKADLMTAMEETPKTCCASGGNARKSPAPETPNTRYFIIQSKAVSRVKARLTAAPEGALDTRYILQRYNPCVVIVSCVFGGVFLVAFLVSSLLASGPRARFPVGGACVRVFCAALVVVAARLSCPFRSLGSSVAASFLRSRLPALWLLGLVGLRLSCCLAFAAFVRVRLVRLSCRGGSPFRACAPRLGVLVAVAAFGGSGGGIAAAAAATGGLENTVYLNQ